MTTKITSPKNNHIKEIISLQSKSKERKKSNLIVIEGQKEISLAIVANVKIKKLVFCSEIISFEQVQKLIKIDLDDVVDFEIFDVSESVFSKISYRKTTGGVIVVAEITQKSLQDLKVDNQSVFIILESIEKPGNLGAICRVADAANVDGLIICDPHTDIYNPNSIRSSLGCVFTVNVVSSNFEETVEWLKKNKIYSYAAELTAMEFYQNVDFSGNIALVFGTEATGLTDKWVKSADKSVKIPMRGVIDSLNVTTSVAILVYEVMRQRKFS
jgi:TrmH family RNA methyltransferase